MVENNDTPIDNDTAVLNKIFVVKTFGIYPETAKFAKVFTRERFPLYGTCNKLYIHFHYGHATLSSFYIHVHVALHLLCFAISSQFCDDNTATLCHMRLALLLIHCTCTYLYICISSVSLSVEMQHFKITAKTCVYRFHDQQF